MGLNGREVAERIRKEHAAAGRALVSGDGQVLLDVLERMFHPSRLLGDDDRQMHFNLGAYAVVTALRELQRAASTREGGST